jgi:hypothetical protein
MVRSLVALSLALLFAVPARADIFDDFKANVAGQSKTAFEAMAKDMGGLIGATDFQDARVPKLGGFDVSVRASLQMKPDDKNAILRSAGVDSFGLPMLRAEAGLPLGFSVFARGVGYQGASLIGGGVRYQVYKSGIVLAIPNVSVSAGYDKFSHDVLDVTHTGASAMASWNIPIIKPFLGFGLDRAKITNKTGVPGTVGEASATGSRMTVGASITPFPLAYIMGSYTILHGQTAANLGLGLRFGGIL